MEFRRRRYYCLLLAVMFVMFACTPTGCSCSKKKKDDAPGIGALTVSEGPQNGSTGGIVTGGDTNVVMLQFTVATGSAITTIVSVRVTASGTGDDANDVAAARLCHDVNSNGIYDAGDISFVGSTYSADNGSITFTVNQTLNPNTTQNWMVVYDFAVGATGTFICSLADITTDIVTTVGGKINIPQPPTGGPTTITGGTATAQPNTLTVAEGPNNPADSTIGGGQTDVPMLQFSLTAGLGNAVTWTGVTFTASGTGDESTDVVLAELWEDTDNDGTPDSTIGSGETYAADDGTISWTTLTETIATSSTRYFILTYDFAAAADGTFHVEIVDVTTDVVAQVGVDPITPTGTSPVAGPTITIDSTPPYVVRAMFEGADPTTPVAGDTITVYFSETIATTAVLDTHFVLPNTAASDDLGTGATCAAEGTNAVLITLGTGPVLTIPGTFDPASPGVGPSGIDVASPITSITDAVGNAAEQLTPPGVDIKAKFIPDGTAVTDLEVNVLTPTGEQSGDTNGHVMIQYFVAAPAAMTSITLTVEFDDGTGFAAAGEGTAIFTNAAFDPSDTGDLRIWSWDAVTDFASADNDSVTLRFTFDPNTPANPDDDFVDDVTFTLDNKPQAVCTAPYVAPNRKIAALDASNSYVPGNIATLPTDGTGCTWRFASLPGASTLDDTDITRTNPQGKFLAIFQPDAEGDYVLELVVNPGTIDSDTVTTTVHVIAPDNFTGANEAETYDMSGFGGAADEPVMPGYMAYDQTNRHLVYTADNNTCNGTGMGEYVLVRQLLGRFDTTSLPAATAATSPINAYISYATEQGEWFLPYYVNSYNNGTSIGISYLHRTLFTDGATPPTYNLGLSLANVTCFKNVIGYDWTEWEQADLSVVDHPPIGGPVDDWVMGGRLAQVVRGTSNLTYWLVDQQWLDTGTGILYPVRSHLVECSGFENDSGGARIAGTLHWHDGVALPLCDTVTPYQGLAYDVVVQLQTGTPTAWITIAQGPTPGVYYVDLNGGVGSMAAPVAVASYTGVWPAEMVLDENNGYLFVSNRGDANANGSVSVIDLSTRTVVTEVNMPGDYSVRELAIDTVSDPSLLYGTDSARDMVHLIAVDYGGGGTTPLLTCLPSVDTSLHPRDVIFEPVADRGGVLFVSENVNNTILTAEPGGTGWVFDHAATAINTGGEEMNADWAVDPVTGDQCMVYQVDANGGVFFTRSADGGQTWSAPVQVDPGTAAAATENPDIAVDKWGTLVVVWADDTAGAGDLDVYMSRSDDAGATWDTAVKVNTDTDANPQGDPCVTTDFLGNILVAFESSDSANYAIEMVKTVGHQRWTYFGTDDSNIAVSTAGSYDSTDPDIALSPYAAYLPDAWVVWSDTRGTSASVMANYTDNTTTFGADMASGMTFTFGTEVAVTDASAGDSLKPRCAWDPNSAIQTLVVVWEQDRGNGSGIYLDEGGKTGFGTDVVVEEPADATSGTRNNPYISIFDLNFFNVNRSVRAIAYESDLKATGDKDVFWEITQFNSSGWEGEGIRMNAVITGAQTQPLVHVYMCHNSIMTWEDARGGDRDFYSKRQ